MAVVGCINSIMGKFRIAIIITIFIICKRYEYWEKTQIKI